MQSFLQDVLRILYEVTFEERSEDNDYLGE